MENARSKRELKSAVRVPLSPCDEADMEKAVRKYLKEEGTSEQWLMGQLLADGFRIGYVAGFAEGRAKVLLSCMRESGGTLAESAKRLGFTEEEAARYRPVIAEIVALEASRAE